MGSSENFCLRWNDFESNVSGSFRELRAESDFFDVTLACDGSGSHGRTLQAHRVILSACSSFFKQMLRNAAVASPGHPNPLIYLRGVRMADLEAVLDFMYHGEVNVAQEDLNSFLQVAEDLQIKGLTQQSNKDLGGGKKSRKSATNTSSSAGPSNKRRRPNDEDDLDDDVINVKNEPVGGFDTSADIDTGASTSGAGAGGSRTDVGGNGGFEDDGEAGGAAFDNFDDSYGGYGEGSAGGAGAAAVAAGEGAAIIEGGMGASIEGQDSTKGRTSYLACNLEGVHARLTLKEPSERALALSEVTCEHRTQGPCRAMCPIGRCATLGF